MLSVDKANRHTPLCRNCALHSQHRWPPVLMMLMLVVVAATSIDWCTLMALASGDGTEAPSLATLLTLPCRNSSDTSSLSSTLVVSDDNLEGVSTQQLFTLIINCSSSSSTTLSVPWDALVVNISTNVSILGGMEVRLYTHVGRVDIVSAGGLGLSASVQIDFFEGSWSPSLPAVTIGSSANDKSSNDVSSTQSPRSVIIVVHNRTDSSSALRLGSQGFFVMASSSDEPNMTVRIVIGCTVAVGSGESLLMMGPYNSNTATNPAAGGGDIATSSGQLWIDVQSGAGILINASLPPLNTTTSSLPPAGSCGAFTGSPDLRYAAAGVCCSNRTTSNRSGAGASWALDLLTVELSNATLRVDSATASSGTAMFFWSRVLPTSVVISVSNSSTLRVYAGDGPNCSAVMLRVDAMPPSSMVTARPVSVALVVTDNSSITIVRDVARGNAQAVPLTSWVALMLFNSTSSPVVVLTASVGLSVTITVGSLFTVDGPRVAGVVAGEDVVYRTPPRLLVTRHSTLAVGANFGAQGGGTYSPDGTDITNTSTFFGVAFPAVASNATGLLDATIGSSSRLFIVNAALYRCWRLSSVTQLWVTGGSLQLSNNSIVNISGSSTTTNPSVSYPSSVVAVAASISWRNVTVILTAQSMLSISGSSAALVSGPLSTFSDLVVNVLAGTDAGCSINVLSGGSLLWGLFLQNVSLTLHDPSSTSSYSPTAAVVVAVAVSNNGQLLRADLEMESVTVLMSGPTVLCRVATSSRLLSSISIIDGVNMTLQARARVAIDGVSSCVSATNTIIHSVLRVVGGAIVDLTVSSSFFYGNAVADMYAEASGTATNITVSGGSSLIRALTGQSSDITVAVVQGASLYVTALSSSCVQYSLNCCNATVRTDGVGSVIVVDTGAALTRATLSTTVIVQQGAMVRIGSSTSALIRSALSCTVLLSGNATLRLTSSTSGVLDQIPTGSMLNVLNITAQRSVNVLFDPAAAAITSGWLVKGEPSASPAATVSLSLDNVTFSRTTPLPSTLFALPLPMVSAAVRNVNVTVTGNHTEAGVCVSTALVRRTTSLFAPLAASDLGMPPSIFFSLCVPVPTPSISFPTMSHSASARQTTSSTRISTPTKDLTRTATMSLVVVPPPPPEAPIIKGEVVEQVGAVVAVGATIAGAAGVAPSVVRAALSSSLLNCASLSLFAEATGNYFQVRIGDAYGASHRGLAIWSTSVIVGCCILTYAAATMLRYFFTDIMKDPLITLRICLTKMYMPGLLSVPFLLLLPSLVAASVALLQVSVGDALMGGIFLLVIGVGCSSFIGWVLTSRFFSARFRETEICGDAEDQALFDAKQAVYASRYPTLAAWDGRLRRWQDGEGARAWHDLPGHGGFIDRFGRWFQFYRPGREWYLMVEVVISCICGVAQGAAANGGDRSCRAGQVIVGLAQIAAFVILVVLSPYISRVRQWVAGLIALCGAVFGAVLLFMPLCPDGTNSTCRSAAVVLTLIPAVFAAMMPLLRVAMAVTSTALAIGFQRHCSSSSVVLSSTTKRAPSPLDHPLMDAVESSAASSPPQQSTPVLKSTMGLLEAHKVASSATHEARLSAPSSSATPSPLPHEWGRRHSDDRSSGGPLLQLPQLLETQHSMAHARSSANASTTPRFVALPPPAASLTNLSFSMQQQQPRSGLGTEEDLMGGPVNGHLSFSLMSAGTHHAAAVGRPEFVSGSIMFSKPPDDTHAPQRLEGVVTEEQLVELTQLVEWVCSTTARDTSRM